MKFQNPSMRQILAAEYLLGTLRGTARRRFAARLRNDPGLSGDVAFWETHLAHVAGLHALTPPPEIWDCIERAAQMKSGVRCKSPQIASGLPNCRTLLTAGPKSREADSGRPHNTV